ncbi:MAG: cobalamin-dependent protein [Chloroflexota bacterium]|nr:cobalamin-dependent protein [Chloroflexota bacterium]
MRILLIATNRHNRLVSRMNAQPLPIGMAYVAGHLDPDRHQLKVLDLMFSDDYLADVEAAVHEFQPELVGLSLRNLSNHSYLDPQWALPITREVIDKIREGSSAPIVCGGPAFSLLPNECFAYLEPDLGLAGDAGETFAELAGRIEIGEPSYLDLPGLVYRNESGIQFNGMRCRSDFSMPPRFDELDMEKYRLAGFGVGIVTKLGDFNYPTSPGSEPSERSAWRVIRPIEEVVQEVQDMEARFRLRKVHFIDNGFNIPLAHAKQLCQALSDADVGVHWTTGLAPYSCDSELVGMMKDAGCVLVMMGNMRGDSHDGTTLGERMDPMLATCRTCEEGGLNYTIAQRFGEPGETRESVEEKLAFLRGIRPSMANLRVGVSIMPGTPEARLAVEEGLVADESELIRPTFYIAPEVREWIVDHLKQAAAKQPRWNLL